MPANTGGHRCTYKRQWNEDRINAAVEEIIRKFVKNPKFEQKICKQIGSSIDTSELDREYDGLKDRLSQTTGAKNRLADQMDHLSVSDKNYDKKYNDMQERLDKLYDRFTDLEKKTFMKSFLSDTKTKKRLLRYFELVEKCNQINENNV